MKHKIGEIAYIVYDDLWLIYVIWKYEMCDELRCTYTDKLVRNSVTQGFQPS